MRRICALLLCGALLMASGSAQAMPEEARYRLEFDEITLHQESTGTPPLGDLPAPPETVALDLGYSFPVRQLYASLEMPFGPEPQVVADITIDGQGVHWLGGPAPGGPEYDVGRALGLLRMADGSLPASLYAHLANRYSLAVARAVALCYRGSAPDTLDLGGVRMSLTRHDFELGDDAVRSLAQTVNELLQTDESLAKLMWNLPAPPGDAPLDLVDKLDVLSPLREREKLAADLSVWLADGAQLKRLSIRAVGMDADFTGGYGNTMCELTFEYDDRDGLPYLYLAIENTRPIPTTNDVSGDGGGNTASSGLTSSIGGVGCNVPLPAVDTIALRIVPTRGARDEAEDAPEPPVSLDIAFTEEYSSPRMLYSLYAHTDYEPRVEGGARFTATGDFLISSPQVPAVTMCGRVDQDIDAEGVATGSVHVDMGALGLRLSAKTKLTQLTFEARPMLPKGDIVP